MFTGIVEERGAVVERGLRFVVYAPKVAQGSVPGDSIAINGVCLTVVGQKGGRLSFDLSPETLKRSSLGSLERGDPVNLERAVTLLTRLGGHLVQGHVDGVGEISEIREVSSGKEMKIRMADGLGRYLVEKGSIAVDGVSLTVSDISGGEFGVALIPYTLDATTLGTAKPGDRVNLEVDMLAKYVESLMRGSR